MKTITIKISTYDGSVVDEQVECVRMSDLIAVHRTPRSATYYTVTHIPTGRFIISYPCEAYALQAAKVLSGDKHAAYILSKDIKDMNIEDEIYIHNILRGVGSGKI